MREVSDMNDLLRGHLVGVKPQLVDAAEVVNPYHDLLCHDHDMTSTLARFHGGEVSLEVLHEETRENNYHREVLLKVGGKTVEYGVILIFLEQFPDEVRREILSGEKPLGAILNESGMAYESSPVGYLKIDGSAFAADFFPSCDGEILFGRYNRLLGKNERVLARIIEILPTEKP